MSPVNSPRWSTRRLFCILWTVLHLCRTSLSIMFRYCCQSMWINPLFRVLETGYCLQTQPEMKTLQISHVILFLLQKKQFVCENDINKPASHFASRGCHQAVMDLSLKGRKEWAITPTQGRRTRQQPQLEALYFDEFICCSVPWRPLQSAAPLWWWSSVFISSYVHFAASWLEPLMHQVKVNYKY